MVGRTWILVSVITSACGRFHFDPIGAGDDVVEGDGGTRDGPRGDGGGTPIDAPAGSGMACPRTGTPSCPQSSISLTMFGVSSSSASTAGKGDGLAGSCGGAGAEEQTVLFLVQQTAAYTFTTRNSDYDTVLYIRDADCGGAELACNDNVGAGVTSQVTLNVVAGQRVVAIVDGANGLCGNYSLLAGVNP